MKYMMLIYGQEGAWDETALRECYVESAEYAKSLHAKGKYLGASPLQSISTATSVKMRGGKRLVTDGPFAETREQLGGYFLIDAENLEEAIEIAGNIPGARIGTVEVRPLVVIEGLPEQE